MSHEMIIENATKAAQCADLLLKDLQNLLFGGDAILSYVGAAGKLRCSAKVFIPRRWDTSYNSVI